MVAQSRHKFIDSAASATPAVLTQDVLSVLLISVPALFVAVVNLHISYDDAFITYRYAYNLASGQGFVYNPGEWFMGTTAPFYGLLLGVLGWLFGPDAIPTISGVISGLSLLLAGVALYVYGRLHGHALVGLLAGLFFVCNRLLPYTFGGEMLFQAALILWAFVLYRLDRTLLAAFLLALAVLTRMDSVIALGVVGLHFLVTRRRLPWRAGVVVALTLLPFVLLSWWFYGALLPVTLGAKLAQRDSRLWGSFLGGLAEWMRAFTFQGSSTSFVTVPASPNAIRFIYFAVAGLPALLLFRFWLLPLAWVALYLIGYALLDVPFYHWYVVPLVVGLVILAACGVAGVVALLLRGYERLGGPRVSWARLALSVLALLALLPSLAMQLNQTRSIAGYGANPAERLYDQAGEWLRANTPPDASVGYFEIGRLGYVAQRRVVDPLGLLDPAVPPHVAAGDLLWAYEYNRPDYILYNDVFAGWFASMRQEQWFVQKYRWVAEIKQPLYPKPLIIYKRKPDESFPDAVTLASAQNESNRSIGTIFADHAVSQRFTARVNQLAAVELVFATYDRTNHATVTVSLHDEHDSTIATWRVPAEELFDNQWRRFYFPPIADSAGKTFTLTIQSDAPTKGNAITLWMSDNAPSDNAALLQYDSDAVQGVLAFRTYAASNE